MRSDDDGKVVPFPAEPRSLLGSLRSASGHRASEALRRVLAIAYLIEQTNADALPNVERLLKAFVVQDVSAGAPLKASPAQAVRDLLAKWPVLDMAGVHALLRTQAHASHPTLPPTRGPRGPAYWILDTHEQPFPVDTEDEWRAWHETHQDDCFVAQDIDPRGRWRVRTTFRRAVLDIAANEMPLLWETVVRGGIFDGLSDLHPSRVHAFLGHVRMLTLVESLSTAVIIDERGGSRPMVPQGS